MRMHVCIYMCVCMCMCVCGVCVCVCVNEREREREKKKERERLFYEFTNHTKFKFDQIRTQLKIHTVQFHFSDTSMTLQSGQDYQKWYAWVEFSIGYNRAKTEILC